MSRRRIPEDRAREILDRALRLEEAERFELTLAELRTLAAEMGITPAALDRALRDMEPDAGDAETWVEKYTRWLSRALPGWSRTALIAASAFIWGVFTRVIERGGSEEPVLAMIVAVGGAAVPLIIHHRRKGSPIALQGDLLVLWGMLAAGLLLVPDTIWPVRNVFALTGALWALSATVGAALIALPDRARPPEVGEDALSDGSSVAACRQAAVTTRGPIPMS